MNRENPFFSLYLIVYECGVKGTKCFFILFSMWIEHFTMNCIWVGVSDYCFVILSIAVCWRVQTNVFLLRKVYFYVHNRGDYTRIDSDNRLVII